MSSVVREQAQEHFLSDLILVLASFLDKGDDVLSLGLVNKRFHSVLLQPISQWDDKQSHKAERILSSLVKPAVSIAWNSFALHFYNALPNGEPHGRVQCYYDVDDGATEARMSLFPQPLQQHVATSGYIVSTSSDFEVIEALRRMRTPQSWLKDDYEMRLGKKKIGKSTSYFSNGTVESEQYYNLDGEEEGPSRFWCTRWNSDELVLRDEINFHKGQFHGPRIMRSYDGNLEKTTNYNLGDVDGIEETYWEFPFVKSRRPFKRSQVHGVAEYFYKNGVRSTIVTYEHGKKMGKYQVWWLNGNPRIIATYKDGKYDGDCCRYSEEGILVCKTPYNNGFIDGTVEEAYREGIISTSYKNGVPLRQEQYKNGKLVRTLPFENGNIEGFVEEYKDGKIIKRTPWKNGQEVFASEIEYWQRDYETMDWPSQESCLADHGYDKMSDMHSYDTDEEDDEDAAEERRRERMLMDFERYRERNETYLHIRYLHYCKGFEKVKGKQENITDEMNEYDKRVSDEADPKIHNDADKKDNYEAIRMEEPDEVWWGGMYAANGV